MKRIKYQYALHGIARSINIHDNVNRTAFHVFPITGIALFLFNVIWFNFFLATAFCKFSPPPPLPTDLVTFTLFSLYYLEVLFVHQNEKCDIFYWLDDEVRRGCWPRNEKMCSKLHIWRRRLCKRWKYVLIQLSSCLPRYGGRKNGFTKLEKKGDLTGGNVSVKDDVSNNDWSDYEEICHALSFVCQVQKFFSFFLISNS